MALLEAVRITDVCAMEKKEKELLKYDVTESVSKIEVWKTHILAIINQEKHKRDVLSSLDDSTCLVIIDYAMKFLARKYRESMADWFGKAGNGMHVMCVLYKDEDGLAKKTYLNFTGKSPQGTASVVAIYETCLRQLKKDLPHLHNIIDKSDNAGCYHNEALFAWKSYWPEQNTGHKFIATSFNERQAGKLHNFTLTFCLGCVDWFQIQ